MGLVNGKLLLKNPRLPGLAPVEVVALADSGALHLCIPEHVQIQLKLDAIDHKAVTLAAWARSRAAAGEAPALHIQAIIP
jgi:hypothetical protein